ncbi:hypothetical protein PN836_005870 [Ningiella sp. W23]|uniref:hypothetical protein n=1 Tax=Ningiella sp. W23 TaxID=3023715 RepID=UPI0037567024
MLEITEEQITAFKAKSVSRFEAKMKVYLTKTFPDWSLEKTPNQLHSFIICGIDIAKGYNLFSEKSVCKFIGITVILGQDFDSKPEYLWAKEILENPEKLDEAIVIDKLCSAVVQDLNQKET